MMLNIEMIMDKIIKLKEKDLKLLLTILEAESDSRSYMTCNDPYSNEESIFTQEERIVMAETQYPKDFLKTIVNDGFMHNNMYVDYIIEIIKKQIN